MIDLETKLETNQTVQKELENKVEQTAAAVEEVKTTMTKGKDVDRWTRDDLSPLK